MNGNILFEGYLLIAIVASFSFVLNFNNPQTNLAAAQFKAAARLVDLVGGAALLVIVVLAGFLIFIYLMRRMRR